MTEDEVTKEFWVVGGRYRDVTFVQIEEGCAEAYGPFAGYDEAFSSWSIHSSRTRSLAAVRYSIVVTASKLATSRV
jgi:hypothetical protein